jgi:hypothetical protein
MMGSYRRSIFHHLTVKNGSGSGTGVGTTATSTTVATSSHHSSSSWGETLPVPLTTKIQNNHNLEIGGVDFDVDCSDIMIIMIIIDRKHTDQSLR